MSRQHKASWDVLGMAQRSFTAEPARTARRRLEDAIEAEEGLGLIVPCRDGDPNQTRWWISDDPDEQKYAASLCDVCPALKDCQAFALTFPHEAGVLGAWTEHDRRKPLHKRTRQQVA